MATDKLVDAAKEAVALAHESRRYSKALRLVEKLLLRGLGYDSFADFKDCEKCDIRH